MPITGQNFLSDVAVKAAKPRGKQYNLRDGAGLFLVVEPGGKKWWKYRTVFAKKETSFSFGEYPLVSLSQARGERDKANSSRANGIDPTAMRRAEKATQSSLGALKQWLVNGMHVFSLHGRKPTARLCLFVSFSHPPYEQ